MKIFTKNIPKLSFVKKTFQGFLLFLVVSTTSYAQDSLLSFAERNGIYVSIETGRANIIYPKNNFFAQRGEVNPWPRVKNLDTDDNRASGSLLSATLGTYFPLNFADAFKTKAELKIWRAKTKQASKRSFYDTGAGVRYGYVDFDNSTGYGTPNGTSLHTSINQEIEYYGQDFLFSLEYKQKEGGMWTLFAGPSFKTLEQNTLSEGKMINAVGTTISTVALTERLSTKLKGAKLGAKYSRHFNDTWSMSLDVSASRYNSKTNYTGAFYRPSIFIPKNVNRSLGATDAVNAIDTRLEVAYKIAKGLDISAFAEMNHLSSVPLVNYGSVPTDPNQGVLRLETAKNFTMYVLGLKLTKAF